MDAEDSFVRKPSPTIRFFLLLVFVISLLQTGLSAQERLLPDPGPTLTERFGRIPAPGVHPRVLFGPDELPRLRQVTQQTEVGKYMLGRVDHYVEVLRTGQPLAAEYEGLVKGDLNAATYVKEPFWQNKIGYVLSLECFEALLRQDQVRGQQAGAALAAYASIPRDWVKGNPDIFLALAYDFDYVYMTDAQRRVVRQAISLSTSGKKIFGDDMPADWRMSNWTSAGTSLAVTALAIEGEQGYDAALYPQCRQVMEDYLHYGITQAGGGIEEMHYFNFGMGFGGLALVAFARHGDDLFSEPHYRALPNWLVAAMEPYGDAFSMHQDSPNDQGGSITNYLILKWLWPKDLVVDMVWRNRVGATADGLGNYGDWLFILPFPSDPVGWKPYKGPNPHTKWGLNEAAIPPNYPDAVSGIEALKLPLTYWDQERGLQITRNKWGRDGMVLHLDMNTEANYAAAHAHSNSGEFTLSALGRKWAIDRGFHVAETKDNSCILIDGRGQGFFPIGGATVERREDPNLTVMAGDASEPYHWITRAQNRLNDPAVKAFHWEPDTNGEIVRRFDENATITNKAEPWHDKQASQYPFQAVYNPVQKAFRTAALRRNGSHDYVLIVDDIKKDASSHQYDWLMQVADDLEVKSTNGNSIVLGSADAKDNRRLLVRMIGVSSGGSWIFEKYEVKRTPESGDTASFGMGNRLRYSVRSVEPGFKVLLYPYREGDALPEVSANGPLEVLWANQKDDYALTMLPTGRTEVRMR